MKCPKCGEGNLVRGGHTPAGKQRWAHKLSRDTVCYQTTNPSARYRDKASTPRRSSERVVVKHSLPQATRYVVTWAQNATPVHKGFLAALLAFCKHNKAELVVIPGRYKNPTSTWDASQENAETWAPEVTPYLFAQRKALHRHLHVIGDLKIQPTMQQPLTGLEGLTHSESCVVGHPRLAFRTVATPAHRMPKILASTGAVTVANYTDSRTGRLGAFHHTLGAALVEVCKERFHLRQLNYSERFAGFIDLDTAYMADGSVAPAAATQALVFGDAHWRFVDKEVERATFRHLCRRLAPGTLVWHDVLDAYAVNPHHAGDPFVARAKHLAGYTDIQQEVEATIDWIQTRGKGHQNVVVASNHDNMLRRWVTRADWKTDPTNAEFYLETALAMLRSTKMTRKGTSTLDPFQQLVNARGADNVLCVPAGNSYQVADIELGLHGDQGPNGARGNIRNLRRIGPKVIIGHSHSPAINEGAYQVGTMTALSLEYTGPVGGWLNTHCSIDAFGKRHLHTCVDGEFWLS